MLAPVYDVARQAADGQIHPARENQDYPYDEQQSPNKHQCPANVAHVSMVEHSIPKRDRRQKLCRSHRSRSRNALSRGILDCLLSPFSSALHFVAVRRDMLRRPLVLAVFLALMGSFAIAQVSPAKSGQSSKPGITPPPPMSQAPAKKSPPTSAAKLKPAELKGLDVNLMDKSADPCVDFYQYSCGGGQNRIPFRPIALPGAATRS